MTNKDKALVEYILNGTAEGTLRWEPTAVEHELLATLRGSHSITITRFPPDQPDVLTLRNSNGQEILTLDGNDDQRINKIFPTAQRGAFDVDRVIDEIIGGSTTQPPLPAAQKSPAPPITDEDIPF
jgi:hypothetical protein